MSDAKETAYAQGKVEDEDERYDTDTGFLDRSDSKIVRSEDGPPKKRLESAKTAIKSAEQKLRQSTR